MPQRLTDYRILAYRLVRHGDNTLHPSPVSQIVGSMARQVNAKQSSVEMASSLVPGLYTNVPVLVGASGGDEFDAEAGELAREIYESSLVGDAENGALDAGSAAGHDWPRIMKD
jgi:hypothetical protein